MKPTICHERHDSNAVGDSAYTGLSFFARTIVRYTCDSVYLSSSLLEAQVAEQGRRGHLKRQHVPAYGESYQRRSN